jgi:two-component system, OmpR family, sensor kinase
MSRLPIRARLTLAFAAVMAVALSALGLLAYHRIADGLSQDLDRELAARAQDLSGLLARTAPGSLEDLAGTGLVERGESFAEVEAPDGTVLAATSTLRGRPLLSRAEVRAAAHRMLVLDRPDAPGLDEPARLLATRVTTDGRDAVLIVGNTRENGVESLARVRHQLLLLLPLLLVVTTVCGHLLSGAALRPVEAMRRRATGMTAEGTGQRLPVPPGHDELARLGETLNDLLARVEAARAGERTFVARASHELRTPLTLLRTELELALRRPRTADQLHAAVQSAEEEVDRLTRLANSLLLLAGEDREEMAALREPVDLHDLLADEAARFGPIAAEDGRTIRCTAPNGLRLDADPQRLRQAVRNLVQNALDHGAGDVLLDAVATGDGVEVRVTDAGPGFSSELAGRAFEPFARAAAGHGTGLGLAVVASVARAHGGSAGTRDSPDGGTDVWFRLARADNP